ncbi:hypothetical protein [Sandaracinus amylolyticus]|uniref:Uncharacterized protein n=1 Tax=Sandaracinus amylolyticus TaxID=927083 RepID=A0A0F6YJG9_9BACT|nr:hypothetical protein [Sandaracinus amylolyticus]AKF06082.1 hypothetical protein DB32_003231 [Sandaracinus amylolyticus]
MTFRPLTEPIDYIVLAGRRSPGIATIEGADTPRDFDERRGFGVSFARLRFRGVKLARFKVLIELVTEQDWDDWHTWKDLVARPEIESDPRRQSSSIFPRLTAPPLDIEHPILADLGITAVVIENALQPVQTDPGKWAIEIRCIEYRAPIVALEQTQGARDRQGDNIESQIELNSRTIAELSNPAGLAGT